MTYRPQVVFYAIVCSGVLALGQCIGQFGLKGSDAEDADSCLPHAYKSIDGVCHCAVDQGWLRCEMAGEIRHAPRGE